MPIRYILPLMFMLALPYLSMAQEERQERRKERKERVSEALRLQEEGVITHKKSFVVGPKLTNDGYGIFFELGRAQSIERALLYQLEITERKSPKEMRFGSAVPYGPSLIYGKENFVYPVKLGVQQQFLLGNKSNKNGVAITGNIGGGFVAAMLRPYYVQVLDAMGGLEYIKYENETKSDFLDHSILVSGPSLNKGWNEMTVTPGAYGKAALRFDYGRFNEIVTGIEVGITGEFYAKKVPQMVMNDPKQFFFGAYCALLFGKRK